MTLRAFLRDAVQRRHRFFPFATMCELRRDAWGGERPRYRYVYPVADKWKVRISRTAARRRSA